MAAPTRIGADLVVAAVAQAGLAGYVILYLGVAASWIGVPIVGASALAAAGVLAADGSLNIWLVIIVASIAAWTGGHVGYWLGGRAGTVVTERDGRWQRERRQLMASGELFYRRWGRLAVFVTPTWVSGALKMPRGTFLIWNALAAIVSTVVAPLGAYGIAAAVIGQLSARRGILALAVAAVTLVALVLAVRSRRLATSGTRWQPRPPSKPSRADDRSEHRR